MTDELECTEIVMVDWTPELVAKAEPPGMLSMFCHYAWEHCAEMSELLGVGNV